MMWCKIKYKFLSKTVLTLFLLMSSIIINAEVGESYYCKENKMNVTGTFAEFVFDWEQGFIRERSIDNPKLISRDQRTRISFSTPYYFITLSDKETEKKSGKLFQSFNGKTFTTHYVEENYTFITDYSCRKLR
jgi:hypothetical protein